MTRLSLIFLFAAMATGMFVIKNRVIVLENELETINARIQSDQKALHVLKAEWTHLNDPSRIRELSTRHAKMKPVKGEQIISFSAIPFKSDTFDTPTRKATAPAGIIQVSYAPTIRE